MNFSSFPFGVQYLSLPVHDNLSEDRVDSTIHSEIERQQSKMLEKMSTIFDNKLETMKRQLEDVSTKAHESQMSELKCMKFSDPRFKKKGHEQQYKHNEKAKATLTEAKDAIVAQKEDACISKLKATKPTWVFSGSIMVRQPFLFLMYCHLACPQPLTFLLKF